MASSLISCSKLISLNCKSPAQNRKTSLSGRKLRSESGGGAAEDEDEESPEPVRETMIKVSRKAPGRRCGELAGPREAPDGTAL